MTARRGSAASKADRILAVVRAARDVSSGIRYELDIADSVERVPAVFTIPHAQRLVPAALLLHGLGSTKERMAESMGDALVRHGIAALSVDLPLHGGRPGAPRDLAGARIMELIGAWRGALKEARVALAYLETHEQVDPDRLAIVGYSLGSFIANMVASEDLSVRAVVLAASGDLPEGLPFASVIRRVVDPLRAVRRINGRPLLMVNGRFDRTVTPAQAERLFAAAGEPKAMRWYGGGHWPPAREVEAAARWLASQLRQEQSRTSRTRASSGG